MGVLCSCGSCVLGTCLRYGVFKDRYLQKWSSKLSFRGKSEFPECDTCHMLKEGIRQSKDLCTIIWQPVLFPWYINLDSDLFLIYSPSHKDLQTKLQYVHEYKDHLQSIQRDRSLEQMLQSEEVYVNDTPVLFVQTDGMDQAKWGVPRYFADRPSKEMAKVVRCIPKCAIMPVRQRTSIHRAQGSEE